MLETRFTIVIVLSVYFNRFSRIRGLRRKRFSKVFRQNLFHGQESLSGEGSSLEQTETIRHEISKALSDFNIRSVLDIPCGDFNWMKEIEAETFEYLGADVVPELIEMLSHRNEDPRRSFIVLDIVRNSLPKVDLIFCRDLLVHLESKDVFSAIRNIKASGSKWLMTTNFTADRPYKNLPAITRGIPWRPINFSLSPFSFPIPAREINEGCTEDNGKFSDKSLCLYEIASLPNY